MRDWILGPVALRQNAALGIRPLGWQSLKQTQLLLLCKMGKGPPVSQVSVGWSMIIYRNLKAHYDILKRTMLTKYQTLLNEDTFVIFP